jgi:hypothetical protein
VFFFLSSEKNVPRYIGETYLKEIKITKKKKKKEKEKKKSTYYRFTKAYSQ